MTPEQIRAEAIERIARAAYERWQRAYDKIGEHEKWSDKAPSWEEAPEGYKRKAEAIRNAETIVEDLGDMLRPARIDEPIGWLTGFEYNGRWEIDSDAARLYQARFPAEKRVTEFNASDDCEDLAPWYVLEVRKVPE